MARFEIVLEDTPEGLEVASIVHLAQVDEDISKSRAISIGKDIIVAITPNPGEEDPLCPM